MSFEEEELKRLRQKALEVKKKRRKFRFSFPHMLRLPLIWTLFFVIVGLIQQSIIEKKVIIFEFFTTKYIDWFASFGNFATGYQVSGIPEVFRMIISGWYYFFFTGGLLSLLWAIIHIVINAEFGTKKDPLVDK
ncbi:MAG: hypothetical protein AABX85_03660 [Nanoarchaeota archaeon]